MADEGGEVRILEKRRVEGSGLRFLLSKKKYFPKPVRFYDPDLDTIKYVSSIDVIFDASIPEKQWKSYERFSSGRNDVERILVLLGVLGYSYPTTAISEVTGIPAPRINYLLWSLKREGFVSGAQVGGVYVNEEFHPYRYGPIEENHWTLTEKGWERARDLMRFYIPKLGQTESLPVWKIAEQRAEQARRELEERKLKSGL